MGTSKCRSRFSLAESFIVLAFLIFLLFLFLRAAVCYHMWEKHAVHKLWQRWRQPSVGKTVASVLGFSLLQTVLPSILPQWFATSVKRKTAVCLAPWILGLAIHAQGAWNICSLNTAVSEKQIFFSETTFTCILIKATSNYICNRIGPRAIKSQFHA